MRHRAWPALAAAVTLAAAGAGCSIPSTPFEASGYLIGGQVRGLWDGADGVALRLEADGVNTLLTVSTNGDFSFARRLAVGASYAVTVVAQPPYHSCTVDAGGNGTVEDADVMNLVVGCRGPAEVSLWGPWGWAFDPTQDTQRFAGSVAVQEVALTVGGSDVTSASVGGTPVALGAKTAPIRLPLGATMVPVTLMARGGLSKAYELEFDRGGSVLDQVVYGKASNAGASDNFGYSVAVSGDTLAVGAYSEASAAAGVNGNQADNSASIAGAVYVFVRSGTMWTQQAYVKASNTGAGDHFGLSVAVSGDTLAVGAIGEASTATGVNGNQANNSASYAGAVYVFVRSGTTWTQQAYVKASNTEADDSFGWSVALSGDTLAVGAQHEASEATGVNGNQADNSVSFAGAVYVFVRSGTTWTQQAYVKASNTGAGDDFGYSVALSGDTLAVGAVGEASTATGVGGNEVDNSASSAGAVYVFVRSGATWTQQAYVKASNTGTFDFFGYSVALSGDTLAVGTPNEASPATGVNGNQADNSASYAGAVYVFVRNGATWTQQAYIKASNTGAVDQFGSSVALSGDTLAVGAPFEDNAATGVNGNQADDSANSAGAVYVFVRSGATWMQQAYVKASNTGADDSFGSRVALSGDTLAVGALLEDSAATGVNGNQGDNSASEAGAVYVFR
ncbi:MAG TPA: FG-GAP repeat protein [Kofleriaceae bacterium]|nr:FG-GAP repeat protein [Kofleriaceae bacterium]